MSHPPPKKPEISIKPVEMKPSEWSPRSIPVPRPGRSTADPRTPRLHELRTLAAERASLAAGGGTAWVALAYTHPVDGRPMGGAPYRARFADGSVREGRLADDGTARLDGLPSALAGTAVELRFGEPAAAFRAFAPPPEDAAPNPDYRPDAVGVLTRPPAEGAAGGLAAANDAPRFVLASYDPGRAHGPSAAEAGVPPGGLRGLAAAVAAAPGDAVDDALAYLWALVAGAYKQDPSTGEIVGQTIVAMVPVVGQVADVRDLSAYVYQLTRPGLSAEAERAAWTGVLLSGVALALPVAGAAVAGVGRAVLRGGPVGERLAVRLLRQAGHGDVVRFADRLLLGPDLRNSAIRGFGRVVGDLERFFAAVRDTWVPVAGAVREAATRALAALGRLRGRATASLGALADEIARKVRPMLAKAAEEGEQAAGAVESRVAKQAEAEAAARGPAPEGPEGPRGREPTVWHGRHPRTQKEYEALARDPAHNGNITTGAEQERRVGLGLEDRGTVPGPISRDPIASRGDFIDAKGQVWDVKGFNSNFPPRQGGFRVDRATANVEKSLAKGERVMLDTSKMRAEHVAQLRAEAASRGWGDRIIWWP